MTKYLIDFFFAIDRQFVYLKGFEYVTVKCVDVNWVVLLLKL